MMDCAVVREEPAQLGSGEAVVVASRTANLGPDNRWNQLKWETSHRLILKASSRLLETLLPLSGPNPGGRTKLGRYARLQE